MRAMVVYESIFGNTRQIAEAVAEGLRSAYEVEVVEVGHAGPAPAVDLLVVGGPTHVWSMSRDATRRDARGQAERLHKEPVSTGVGVRDWLRALGRSRDRRLAAVFDTAIRPKGVFPFGSAAKGEAAQLRARGYDLVVEPEQFFVTGTDGPLEAGEVERARAWGLRVATRASEGLVAARPGAPRTSESVGAIVGGLFGLALALLHDVWRPWTLGVVTADWLAVVAPLVLSCIVGILGHTLVLAFPSRFLQRFAACAAAAAGLVAGAALLHVFPFDFGALDMAWFDPVLRLVLLFALFVGAIGLCVQIVRFGAQFVRE